MNNHHVVWIECVDGESTYYYNIETKSTTWEQPWDQWIQIFDASHGAHYIWHSGTGASVWSNEESKHHDVDNAWEELFDESTGNYYFCHITNGESTWEEPAWTLEFDSSSGEPKIFQMSGN